MYVAENVQVHIQEQLHTHKLCTCLYDCVESYGVLVSVEVGGWDKSGLGLPKKILWKHFTLFAEYIQMSHCAEAKVFAGMFTDASLWFV